jgi:uncharacterized protein YrrD
VATAPDIVVRRDWTGNRKVNREPARTTTSSPRETTGKESSVDLRLGSRVVSSDDQHVGKIDRLILDPDTREVVELIVHQGFVLTQDRVVDRQFVASVRDDSTVVLSKTAKEVDELPVFIEHSYVVPEPDDIREIPYMTDWGVGASGDVMPLLWRSNYPGASYDTQHRAELESAPVDAAPVIVESNISENLASIDKGTDVVDNSGKTIGHVEDLLYADDGSVSGLVVRSGFIRHRNYKVDAAKIVSLGGERIHLTISEHDLHAE